MTWLTVRVYLGVSAGELPLKARVRVQQMLYQYNLTFHQEKESRLKRSTRGNLRLVGSVSRAENRHFCK